MFKCQKQVETAAYSNPILSVTLETTVYLNDSERIISGKVSSGF